MTILDALNQWAVEAGSRRAFTFLASGDADGESVSIAYGELQRRALSLASLLRRRCRPKDRILLLYPHGLEYIVGLLGAMYAGAIAVPAYPPQKRSLARLSAIINDAKPALALTTSATVDRVAQALAGISGGSIDCVAGDQTESGEAMPETPLVTESDIAFLQYTSGSTGSPKGVRVTHGGLMRNQRMIRGAFGSGPDATVVGWLPLYHDMGLVGTVLHPLYLGAEGVFISPAHFLQRPIRWLNTISRFRADISGGPDFAFALCAERISAEEKARIDLSSWAVAFNGSERVRLETMSRFAEAFAPCGFRAQAFHPCYGLAESTLVVTAGRPLRPAMTALGWVEGLRGGAIEPPDAAAPQPVASCGGPVCDTEVCVVDPETMRRAPDRVIGEIWVRGPAVSPGYWSDQDRSSSTFNGRLRDQPERRYLRTGDLGFMYDGELFPTGRLKDLIIVDGLNYFPEDLERTAAESHPNLVRGGAAAFSVEDGRRERVVIALEVKRRGGDVKAMIEAVRRSIGAEYRIPVDAIVLIAAASLPRTSSGKTRRRETRARYLAGRLDVVAEWRATRAIAPPGCSTDTLDAPPDHDAGALAEWITQRLGQAIGGIDIRPDEPLGRVGIDSLVAATVAHHLEAALDRPAPMDLFFQETTALDVARHILSQPPLKIPSPVADGEARALTPGQLSLWLLHHIAPAEDPYHIATTIRISGPLDRDAVSVAVDWLVARHAALRTTFIDGPRQRVNARAPVNLRIVDAAGWSDERLEADMVGVIDEVMDFSQGPLARFALYSLAPESHVLLIVAHHIICDGWSMEILQRDFARFYADARAGLPPPAPAASMLAYQSWQEERLRAADAQEQVSYWARRLQSLRPLPIPPGTGESRPAARRSVIISQAQAARVTRLARRMAVQPFVVFAAVLQAALCHATSHTDIVFGIDVANRPRAWMRGIVGMIANQLVLRAQASPEASFGKMVAELHALMADARRNQDAPFSWVVSAINPPRRFGRNPLFQLMFAYRNRELPVQEVDGALMRPGEITSSRPKFDATLALTHDGAALSGFWEFNPAAVDLKWADRLADAFEAILDRAVEAPSSRLCDLLGAPGVASGARETSPHG